MKSKLWIWIVLLSFSSISSLTNESTVIRLNMIDDYQSIKFNKLDFGIHPLATTGLDTALGERELPPFIPPDGLHGVFLINDSIIGNNLWSYINLMPIPKNKKDSVIFRFEVHNIVQALNFNWLPLPAIIDSAFIRDRYTGNLIKISMKDSLSAKIINKSITKFEIIAWFDVITNIEEENISNRIKIYPNPASDFIIIHSHILLKNYVIYNQIGNTILSDNIHNSNALIKIHDLIPGIYVIELKEIDGTIHTLRFIKF